MMRPQLEAELENGNDFGDILSHHLLSREHQLNDYSNISCLAHY